MIQYSDELNGKMEVILKNQLQILELKNTLNKIKNMT